MACSCTSRPRTFCGRSLAHSDLHVGGARKVWTVYELTCFLSLCCRRRPPCDHAATSSRSPVRAYSGGATDSVLRRRWFPVLRHVGVH